MKYYIYISDTKVDMLYPQIPKSILKQIASSLSIDLKLLGAEVTIGGKSSQSDETRYSKVQIVSEYIEKHLDVGSIDAPSTYFKGILPMQYGTFEREGVYEKTVYFGGITSHTTLGLGGSARHVIGNNSLNDLADTMPPSMLNGLYKALLYEAQVFEEVPSKPHSGFYSDNILYLVDYMTVQRLKGPKQQLEFLAKTLIQGSFSSDPSLSHIALGTPIYVAIAD